MINLNLNLYYIILIKTNSCWFIINKFLLIYNRQKQLQMIINNYKQLKAFQIITNDYKWLQIIICIKLSTLFKREIQKRVSRKYSEERC
jgi:hypothetical protein